MMIHKITPSVDYNHWLKRLDTQNLINLAKVVMPTIKKRYHKTFGTSVINSPMFPPSFQIPVHAPLLLCMLFVKYLRCEPIYSP